MEMMPHHPTDALASWSAAPGPLPTFGPQARRDWRAGLPTLATPLGTLRELTLADAPSLCAHLTTDDVARFISPPPASVEGFEDFIRWAHQRRAQGRYVCFGIVPAGQVNAVGMFQVRLDESDPARGEWGFVLGAAYWGTGLFLAGAQRILTFAFSQLGLDHLEARAVLQNGRGNGALHKVGAVRVTVLRGSFERHGERLDQALWTLTRQTWTAGRRVWRHPATDRPRGPRLAARGASPSAFAGCCIPPGGVAPPSNTPRILGRRAWPSGRIRRLGATPDLHHGLLALATGRGPRLRPVPACGSGNERWSA